MARDWFGRETHPLLADYCRHIVRLRELARVIDEFRMEWVKAKGGAEKLDQLLRMAERETRCVTALARALRLTNQSRYDAHAAARKATGPRPSVYDLMAMETGDDED